MKQNLVLYICLASLFLVTILMAITTPVVNAQQQYEFVTQWGWRAQAQDSLTGKTMSILSRTTSL